MANVLRGYGAAREGSFFKQEQVGAASQHAAHMLAAPTPPCAQEADIQELRRKLIKEGKLAVHPQPAPVILDRDGEPISPVLMEVLQASARLADPSAARKRIWELCVSSP